MRHEAEQLHKMISEGKIIAIMRKIPENVLVPTVEALYRGGIRLMEVTFDPAGEFAEESTLREIAEIADKFPEIAVGAGTVLSKEQVKKAVEAGAEYIISPNVDESVIRMTKQLGCLSMPGALTPTEAVNASYAGADYVKIFPAGSLGAGYIKDIAAPLSNIRFLAVGGIHEKNMKEYLQAGCVGVGVGSNLVSKKLIQSGTFDELEQLARMFAASV